jgi:hypothetical protein
MSDDAVYYRKEWMDDGQWECAKMFAQVRGGFHHVGGEFKSFGRGICVNEPYGGWATYDFSDLTRLVVFAHDDMIRVEIQPSGPRMLKFCLWKRHVREGKMNERHPTLKDAAMEIRSMRAGQI